MLRSSWKGFCLGFVDKTSVSWSHLSSKETGKCIPGLYRGFVPHLACGVAVSQTLSSDMDRS